MNKLIILIFSLSAYNSPSTGRPEPQNGMIYPTEPPNSNRGRDAPSSSHIVFFEPQKQQKNRASPNNLTSGHVTRPRSTLDVTGNSCVFGFCEDVEGYPDDYILSILNQTSEFDKLFNTVVPVIGDRLPDEEENICSSTMNITYPKVGKNVDDKVRIIANLNLYKQGIVMETCRENSVCEFSESLPLGIKTVCKQRYTQLRLLALDDNNKPTLDVFPAPSCCVCMYKRT